MYIRSAILVILGTFFLNGDVAAQDNAKKVTFLEKWPFLQDQQGYIWYVDNAGNIGRWLYGDPSNDADIFDAFSGCDFVNVIQQDQEGKVWIATGCGYYRFDPVTKKIEDIRQMIYDQTGYKSTHTESWCEDGAGTVWIGGKALIGYSLKTKKVEVLFQTGETEMRYNLFRGDGNSIWFSGLESEKFDLNQYDPQNKQIIRKLSFDINTLTRQAYSTVSVKTERVIGSPREMYLLFVGNTVNEFDPAAGTVTALTLPPGYGNPNEICSNDRYNFVATDKGAVLKFEPYNKTFGLVWQHAEKKPLEGIIAARMGGEIFAYVENGLYPLKTNAPLFKKVIELNDSIFRSTIGGKVSTINGKAYLNTRSGLLALNEKYRTDSFRIKPALEYPNDLEYTIGEIPGSSQFWVMVRYFPFLRPGVPAMLNLYDSAGNLIKSHKSQTLDSLVKRSLCTAVISDSGNNTWIFMSDGSVGFFDRKTEQVKLIRQLPGSGMFSPKFAVDKENNLWVGSRGNGLLRYDDNKKDFLPYHNDLRDTSNVSNDNITDLYTAADGRIWIGTANQGISVLNPLTGKSIRLDKKHGLPELIVSDITEDKKGIVWVTTRRYLCQWNLVENRFIVFGNEDGILFDASFIPEVFYREKQGTIYLKSNDAIRSFDPDSLKAYQSYIPPVLLTGFSTNNKHVSVDTSDSLLPRAINYMDKITLRFSQNKFTIQYAAVDFYGSVQYVYRLVGFDNDWQYVKSKTEAIYTNVPPGNYTFQVKALNHQGYWSEIRELPIIVKAPWYRTWLAYAIYAILFSALVWAFIRYRSRYLVKENQRLEEKVTSRTNELSSSLKELKETQNQLVQREKMASLGELTAGIAHEIQNPLNFVNNFSEVNKELIGEMKTEINKGNLEEVKLIADDIEANEEKINHHGKRADAIVKGMLQHSRSSTGIKLPTDINALCDEYLRLSYHGLRAKDKSFNATLKTDFDSTIGTIDIVPQDIGRVVLNLLTNAFYAVNEKKQQQPEGYEPTVGLSTRKAGDKVEIQVKDNGNGIPPKVLDKIFQPFFTTKPTGQGTGLGLSLSYDIIKAHGGELKVESKENEETVFILVLPFKA